MLNKRQNYNNLTAKSIETIRRNKLSKMNDNIYHYIDKLTSEMRLKLESYIIIMINKGFEDIKKELNEIKLQIHETKQSTNKLIQQNRQETKKLIEETRLQLQRQTSRYIQGTNKLIEQKTTSLHNQIGMLTKRNDEKSKELVEFFKNSVSAVENILSPEQIEKGPQESCQVNSSATIVVKKYK